MAQPQGIDPGAPAYAADRGQSSGPEPGETAVMGKRVVAIIVDSIAANVADFVAGLVVALLYAAVAGGMDDGVMPLLYLVGALVVLGYFIGLEATQGQTPGKAMMGIRVVRRMTGSQSAGAPLRGATCCESSTDCSCTSWDS